MNCTSFPVWLLLEGVIHLHLYLSWVYSAACILIERGGRGGGAGNEMETFEYKNLE